MAIVYKQIHKQNNIYIIQNKDIKYNIQIRQIKMEINNKLYYIKIKIINMYDIINKIINGKLMIYKIIINQLKMPKQDNI